MGLEVFSGCWASCCLGLRALGFWAFGLLCLRALGLRGFSAFGFAGFRALGLLAEFCGDVEGRGGGGVSLWAFVFAELYGVRV